jgi:hypothetical protein
LINVVKGELILMCSYFRGLLSASIASLGRSVDQGHRKLPFYPEQIL